MAVCNRRVVYQRHGTVILQPAESHLTGHLFGHILARIERHGSLGGRTSENGRLERVRHASY